MHPSFGSTGLWGILLKQRGNESEVGGLRMAKSSFSVSGWSNTEAAMQRCPHQCFTHDKGLYESSGHASVHVAESQVIVMNIALLLKY